MKFVIKKNSNDNFYWALMAKDLWLCKSATDHTSVEAARQDIARVKKSLGGAKFAKVVESLG